MTTVPWLFNTAWMLKCRAEAAAFDGASRRVADTQARLLLQTLRANRDTDFGRIHRFGDIDDARTYRERVPPATYDDSGRPDPPHRRGRGECPDARAGPAPRTDERDDRRREAHPLHGRAAPPVPARGGGVDARPVEPTAGGPRRPGLLVDLADARPAAPEPRRPAHRLRRRRGLSRPGRAVRPPPAAGHPARGRPAAGHGRLPLRHAALPAGGGRPGADLGVEPDLPDGPARPARGVAGPTLRRPAPRPIEPADADGRGSRAGRSADGSAPTRGGPTSWPASSARPRGGPTGSAASGRAWP